MTGELTGTAGLIRLALRRDRLLIPGWVGLFAAMAAFSTSATVGLYPDEATRIEAANTINSRSPESAWVLVGLVVAVWGIWPHASALVRGAYIAFIVVGEFGQL
jgi:hypothetical protein